jgi:hypothetical protein
MIDLDDLLNIVCTEAYEYDGIPEVPDHKAGGSQSYFSPKREARGAAQLASGEAPTDEPSFEYDLELIKAPDGTLHWIE